MPLNFEVSIECAKCGHTFKTTASFNGKDFRATLPDGWAATYYSRQLEYYCPKPECRAAASHVQTYGLGGSMEIGRAHKDELREEEKDPG